MEPPIQLDKLECRRLRPTHVGLNGFKCSNPYFEEYLKIHAHDEENKHVSKTWIFIYKGVIVGYITIAMAHVEQTMHKDLKMDVHGNVPALLIGYLATHKDYERNGIGTSMVMWAISRAVKYSKEIGCRVVILNPETGVDGFYEKLGFAHVQREEDDTMFIDIKKHINN